MTFVMTNGVWSEMLVDAGRVYFADLCATLTVLDVQTGAVVARKAGIRHGKTLRAVDQGILFGNYGGATLLDRTSLEVRWRSPEGHLMNVVGDRLVAYDINGLMTCRSLDTGHLLWSYDLPDAFSILAKKDKVLVFRSATRDGAKGVPAVALLDLETGRQLWRQTTPPDLHYLDIYFDGERIYLPAGAYTGEHTPDATNYEKGRRSAQFEKMLVWDLNGTEIASIPAPPDLNKSWAKTRGPFVLDGKLFSFGAVRECPRDYHVPQWPWKQTMIMEEADGTGRVEFDLNQRGYDVGEMMLAMRDKAVQFAQNQKQLDLEDGYLTVTDVRMLRPPPGDEPWEEYVDIELKSSESCWKGRLLHVSRIEDVWGVAETPERLLLGTSLGHVECIDRASGKSLWIYVFGWAQHRMARRKEKTSAASATPGRDSKRAASKLGLRLEGSTEPPCPVLIFDPQPDLSTDVRTLSTYTRGQAQQEESR